MLVVVLVCLLKAAESNKPAAYFGVGGEYNCTPSIELLTSCTIRFNYYARHLYLYLVQYEYFVQHIPVVVLVIRNVSSKVAKVILAYWQLCSTGTPTPSMIS